MQLQPLVQPQRTSDVSMQQTQRVVAGAAAVAAVLILQGAVAPDAFADEEQQLHKLCSKLPVRVPEAAPFEIIWHVSSVVRLWSQPSAKFKQQEEGGMHFMPL